MSGTTSPQATQDGRHPPAASAPTTPTTPAAGPEPSPREPGWRQSGPWLSVAGVAESEGVSPRTVLRWIAHGHLESRRQPGGRLRIHLDWYRAMIEQGRDHRRILGRRDNGG